MKDDLLKATLRKCGMVPENMPNSTTWHAMGLDASFRRLVQAVAGACRLAALEVAGHYPGEHSQAAVRAAAEAAGAIGRPDGPPLDPLPALVSTAELPPKPVEIGPVPRTLHTTLVAQRDKWVDLMEKAKAGTAQRALATTMVHQTNDALHWYEAVMLKASARK